MIGSVNMSFPSNMTRWHPWRSIDDSPWSLTALTRDPQGSEQPVPVVTRESDPVSVVWDAVLGFLGSAGGHETLYIRPLWRFHVPAPENRHTYFIRSNRKIQYIYYNKLDVTYFLSLKRLELIWCSVCKIFVFLSWMVFTALLLFKYFHFAVFTQRSTVLAWNATYWWLIEPVSHWSLIKRNHLLMVQYVFFYSVIT